jgi:putative FmdB family regulatory protein
MPVYEYQHLETPCQAGDVFEHRQSMDAAALTLCPFCGGPVKKIVSRVGIRTPKGNSQLKDLGFTKLVKRDDGVYENVTRREGESRYMLRDKPETIPDIRKTITD